MSEYENKLRREIWALCDKYGSKYTDERLGIIASNVPKGEVEIRLFGHSLYMMVNANDKEFAKDARDEAYKRFDTPLWIALNK